MSPCRELTAQYTKSFNMTGEYMTCHDTVSYEVYLSTKRSVGTSHVMRSHAMKKLDDQVRETP